MPSALAFSVSAAAITPLVLPAVSVAPALDQSATAAAVLLALPATLASSAPAAIALATTSPIATIPGLATLKPPNKGYGWTRFEQLNMSSWEGGLQSPNPTFKGIECIVATEVVEHLPEDVLNTFAHILLGNHPP
ncbi:hypothetical protein F5148DRAFT_1295565 [Russula earlei]|uniref:Uncharacterized protein n=1 Tax=Russula earlei TaxID=71964 RepID=A0ACC0TQU6_9AGAM|nr:hypothetical protein F5148DRAFT_1295565 [Russula earlei]